MPPDVLITGAQAVIVTLTVCAGFQSHSHLQAGLASLAGTPDAVMSFLKQAHTVSKHQVYPCTSLPTPQDPPPPPLSLWLYIGSNHTSDSTAFSIISLICLYL